jgi:hypothetical protein
MAHELFSSGMPSFLGNEKMQLRGFIKMVLQRKTINNQLRQRPKVRQSLWMP